MQARATRVGGHGAPTALATLIAGIFTSAPAGVWYDPSDFSTMYQDNLGQTAVTAVEQPVGFILDKSKGGPTRGADVVLNGGFDSGTTNWTTPNAAPGTVVVSGGKATLDSGVGGGGGTARLRQALTVPIGWYEVSYDVSAFSGLAGNAQLALGSDTAGGAQYLAMSTSSVGTQRRVIYVSTTTLGIAFFCGSTTTQTSYTVDNLSIRPLSGANAWVTTTPVVLAANWTDNTGGSYTSNGGTGLLGWDGTAPKLTIGKTYEVTARVTARTAGTLFLPYDGAGGNNGAQVSAVGSFRRTFTATVNSLYIYSNAFNGTVDSIQVTELPGVPLTQATSTSRPVLSARVNQLTYSEAVSNAVWTKAAAGTGTAPTITDNFGVAPDGTTTATRVQLALNGGTTSSDYSTLHQLVTCVVGGTYAQGVWLKTNDGTSKVVQWRDDNANTFNNLITVTSVWQFFTPTGLVPAITSSITARLWLRGAQGTADSADLLMWHPQTEIGATAGPYQRIAAATDYDWLGWPLYLRFDGVDDSMSTGGAATTININLTGTDKMTLLAGVTKLNDAALGIVAELSTSLITNDGTFYLVLPASAGVGNLGFASKGTAAVTAGPTGYPAPIKMVVAGTGDISAPRVAAKVNGAQAVGSFTTQGTGNYGSYPLYVGSRAGSSLRFVGSIYSLLVISRALSPDELFLSERYVGQKMGVVL